MARLLLVALFVATAWAAPRPGSSPTTANGPSVPQDQGRRESFAYFNKGWRQLSPYEWQRIKQFVAENILVDDEEGSGVSPVTSEATTTTTTDPCTTTTVNPCPTTTAAPCPTTVAPCTTTTEATTTTTADPCTTTTTTPCPTTAAPCKTTTTTVAPCPEVTTLPPCTTTEAATTVAPCTTTTTTTEATTTAFVGPCGTTTTRIPDCLYPITQGPLITDAPVQEKVCRDGWTRFHDSCYYFEMDNKKTLKDAEKDCLSRNATLFVADSLDEYESLIKMAPMNTWTWLGLHKTKEQEEPHWHTKSTIDYKEMNWLIKPYDAVGNGWTTVSQCAAHWNPSMDVGKYVFWYPCNYAFHYICELDSTTLKNDIHSLF